MSWVIEMVVAPSRFTQSTMRLLMTSAMIGSRPVVGSSKKMISGSAAMARASPTRFCMPPDSSAGIELAHLGSQPHLAQLLDGDVPGLGARHVAALDQAEGDVLPDGQRVEEGRALEQHAEALQIVVARLAA